MLTLLPKGVKKNNVNSSDFFPLATGVNDAANISGVFEKIWNGPFAVLRGLGETIHNKNLKLKISWHCLCNKCIERLLMLDLILQKKKFVLTPRIVHILYANIGARNRTLNQIATHRPENLEFS
jgi:hypothetical protein